MNMDVCVKLYSLLFCVSICTGISEKRQALTLLQEYIVKNANKKVPPYSENETWVDVIMEYTPLAILDLDSANEILSVSSYYRLIWRDEDLTWDPANYSQQEVVECDPKDIWTPKLVLANAIDTVQPLSSKNSVFVSYTGYISWELSDIFRTRCKINVTSYPFDTQKCKITFVPAHGSDISPTIEVPDFGDTDIAPRNGEWKLEGTSFTLVPVTSKVNLIAGQYTLTLHRKVVYFAINIIFPMALLSILNPFVFLIPARSGEKLAFLMAIFVSHAMFLTLIHQSMPPTSDAISTLAMFLVVIEVQGFLTILATIAVLCVHHRKEKAAEKKEKQSKSKNGPEEEVTQDTSNLVQIKSGRRVSFFCKEFSLERFLDGLFFVMSLALSLAGCVLWVVAY